ncbi:CAP domain-containing protein [Streptomyces sp. NPDC085946]|uniref:CAP domain-containing protein n=1 Tax=Streptomyces sp. NPDC085946 TaxID=3365744 RepID=UPI0037D2528D
MGRHRRSAAGRAATGRATGAAQADSSLQGGHDPLGSYAGDRPVMGIAPYLNPEAYAETYARSEAYLYATDGSADDRFLAGHPVREDHDDHPAPAWYAPDTGTAVLPDDGFRPDDGGRRTGHRRRKKPATPVRTGLLGMSAAVALGTVAVATGAVPGLENYRLGGGTSGADEVQAADAPTNTPSEQGGTSGSADSPAGTPGARQSERSSSPSPSASASAAAPTKTPEKRKQQPAATPSKKPKATPTQRQAPGQTPTREASKKPQAPTTPALTSAEAVAGAEVLRLVNEERAKVGCSPVAADSALTRLAQAFSEDMAARGFFDHTDPDGATPWDRAEKAGISGLGGENIARGQADAEAVMEAWMNSPGHRANILNCDFTTLGVGVHFGPTGPWWTQNFGY